MAHESESALGWLSAVLDEAMRLGVLQPAVLLAHATPEVLAERLPRDLMVKVFASAFATGKLTPEGILEVAPPATLVLHIAPSILWSAARDAATRAHLTEASGLPPGHTPPRALLASALASGLSAGVLGAGDVVRHLPPSTWVGSVPVEVVASLLARGLGSAAWNAEAVLALLTPEVIGAWLAPHLVWGILDEAATRAFPPGDAAAPKAAPTG